MEERGKIHLLAFASNSFTVIFGQYKFRLKQSQTAPFDSDAFATAVPESEWKHSRSASGPPISTTTLQRLLIVEFPDHATK